jgi:hypothetical protein
MPKKNSHKITLSEMYCYFQIMKPAAFEATPPLSVKASKDLVQRIGKTKLTETRRIELIALSASATLAFKKPLPFKANGSK